MFYLWHQKSSYQIRPVSTQTNHKQLSYPVIEIRKSFCYLGRYFDYEMSDDKHKLKLVFLLTSQMKEIDFKPLQLKNKILLYSRYVQPKLAWHLTITSISSTSITENLDSTFVQYIRKWLELPISGTLIAICFQAYGVQFQNVRLPFQNKQF